MGKGRRNREKRLRHEEIGDTSIYGAHVGGGEWAGVSATAISLVMKGETIEEVNELGYRVAKAIEDVVKPIGNVTVVSDPEAQRYILAQTLDALNRHRDAGSFGGGRWRS